MKRVYYASENLDELQQVEQELEQEGVPAEHMHVLSREEATAEEKDLKPVSSLLQRDTIHMGLRGALIGLALCTAVWFGSHTLGLHEPAGTVPFLLLSLMVLGFCTWEGGMIGMHRTNYKFERFKEVLKQGSHVFYVDCTARETASIRSVLSHHPRVRRMGEGSSTINPFVDRENIAA